MSNPDLLKVKEFITLGHLPQALELLQSPSDLLSKIFKMKIYERLGKLDECLAISDEIEQELEGNTLQTSEFKFFHLTARAGLHWRRGELDEGMNKLKDAREIFTILPNQSDQEIQEWLGLNYLTLASINHDLGNVEDAERFYRISLSIREKLNNLRDLAVVYNNLGNILVQRGRLNQALEHYYRSLEYYKELGNENDVGYALGNLGALALVRGNIQEAKELLIQVFEIFKETQREAPLAHTMDYLGMIFYRSGEPKVGYKYLIDCLPLKKSRKNPIQTANTLYYLVIVAMELHKTDDALGYISELQGLDEENNNSRVHLYYRMAKAIQLKASNRGIQILEAQRILTEIAKEPIVDYEIMISTYLNLCDLLILELRKFGNPEILDEINEILERLLSIAEEQNLYSTLAEAFVFKSRLSLLHAEPEVAKNFLERALSIADDNGLSLLGAKISNSYDEVLDLIETLQGNSNNDFSIPDKVELLDLEAVMNELVSQKSSDVEIEKEKPMIFSVLSVNGSKIFEQEFQWGNAEVENVNNFLQNTIKYNTGLFTHNISHRIRFGEYTILLEKIQNYVFAYVFEGKSFSARQKMKAFVDTIKGLSLDLAYLQDLNESTIISLSSNFQLIESFISELFTNDFDVTADITTHNQELELEIKTLEPAKELNLASELKKFKDILHPIRLSILKLLIDEFKISRADITKLLSLSSGAISPHIDFLLENNLISKSNEFIENKPRIVYYLEQTGLQYYNQFKSVLQYV